MKRPVFLALGLFALAGCSDRSQEMEERVTQLQREVERLQTQLAAASQSAAPAKPADDSGAVSNWLSQDTLQQGFQSAEAAMRKNLEDELKGYKVTNSLMQTMPAPADPYPYKSQINLTLVSDAGQTIALSNVPVKADLGGKWVFPTASEITQQIAAAQNPVAEAAAPPQNAAPAEAQPRAVMPVDNTVNVTWGDEPRPAARNPVAAQRPAVQRPAAVAAPTRPPAAMPVNREVEVKFQN